jgi:hypothetical protein
VARTVREMTATTRPATWDDVKLVARYLDAVGADYALIGGYALAVHGLVRFSEDVDVLVSPDPDNALKWIRALAQLPDHAASELEPEYADLWRGDGPLAIRINDEFTVDVMAAACGHGWAELSFFVESRTIDDQPIRVLSVDGLLLTKEGLRDKDRADARMLRQLRDALRSR